MPGRFGRSTKEPTEPITRKRRERRQGGGYGRSQVSSGWTDANDSTISCEPSAWISAT